MSKKEVAIYYSGATDVTGPNLAQALGVDSSKEKPVKKTLVIGYGAKTDAKTTFPAGVTVVNHPDAIRVNRNKFSSLEIMEKGGINVSPFVSADKVFTELAKKKPVITLPLVGRKNYHQGGKGFWLCITEGQVKDAIKKGAQYFQNYIGIADEYRLHVFEGKVIYAQKKAQRDNMEAAFKAQYGDKIKAVAEKAGKKLDEATLGYALGNLSKRVLPEPDMHIRSNTRGWTFKSVKPEGLKADLKTLAIKAVKVVGLDFGAVDCCIDEKGNCLIIEINSGPGLEKTAFDKYVDAFEALITRTFKQEKVVGVQKKAAPAAKKAAAPAADGSIKSKLQVKAELLSDLIANSDENEAAALENVLKKMFG